MRIGAKFAKISITKIYIARFYPALINPHKKGHVYCAQVVYARNLGCHVLNFANVVVNVVAIAVKQAVLPLNSLFALVLRLRKS